MARVYDEGVYRARIIRWAVGEAGTGNPQVVFTVAVEARLLADGEEEAVTPYERSVFRTITEKTIDFVVRDLVALGYDRDDFDGLDPDHPSAFDFAEKEVKVRLRYETHEGKEREKWDFALGAGGPSVKKLDRAGVSKLNARFGGALKAARPKLAPPKAPPPPPPPAGASEEVY